MILATTQHIASTIRLDRNDMKKSINRGVTSLNIENFKYHARCNSFHSTKTFYEIRSHNIKEVGKSAGVTTFKTKEEARDMCDKLNAVLKGEIC